MTTNDQVYAETVRAARERAGLTRRALALLARCSVSDVRKLEGGAWPHLITAFRVAIALREMDAYLRYSQTFSLRARVEALEATIPDVLEAMKRRVEVLEARLAAQGGTSG
jgi:transcriptional regulator with XRE-family HTH domain